MAVLAQGVPPPSNARTDRVTDQSNQTEAFDGSDGDRARFVAERIGADSTGSLGNIRPLGRIGTARSRVSRALSVGSTDRPIQ